MLVMPRLTEEMKNDEKLELLGNFVGSAIDFLCEKYGDVDIFEEETDDEALEAREAWDKSKKTGCACLTAGKIPPFSSCMIWGLTIVNPLATDQIELDNKKDLKAFLMGAQNATKMPMFELNQYLFAFADHEIKTHEKKEKVPLMPVYKKIKKLTEQLAKEEKK